MESASISLSNLDTRVRDVEGKGTRNEVEIKAVKEDVGQINERLDRAARAGYFVGTALLTLTATILGVTLGN